MEIIIIWAIFIIIVIMNMNKAKKMQQERMQEHQRNMQEHNQNMVVICIRCRITVPGMAH